METIYQVLALAVLASSMVTGFIIFRMLGMKLALHFGALMLALVATLAALATGIPALAMAAAALQVLATLTAFTQVWATFRYSFQTSPGFAPHLAMVTMLPVLAAASVLL